MKQKDENTYEEPLVTDLPGIGMVMAEKLAEAGYSTVIKIAGCSVKEFAELTKMTEISANKVITKARDICGMGFVDALEYQEKRKSVFHISTGSKAIDGIIEGGVESGSITEFYGEFGSSKTQIAHQAAVNVQLPVEKGGQGEDSIVIYVDTEGAFRPQRITQMAKGVGLDENKILKNILVARATTSDHQVVLVDKIEELFSKKVKIKLIIIDSLVSQFRAEFVGRGTLADRQQRINSHMNKLKKYSSLYNCAIVVTNQVYENPGQFFGDPTGPVGGHIVGHASTYRIYLRKGKKGTRVAKLIDAPHLADAEAIFAIEEQGVIDVKGETK